MYALRKYSRRADPNQYHSKSLHFACPCSVFKHKKLHVINQNKTVTKDLARYNLRNMPTRISDHKYIWGWWGIWWCEVPLGSASMIRKNHGHHHSDPTPASTSEPLLHLALLLAAPPEARLLNFREPLSVLGPELLHAAALQELLLLFFFTLLQNLVSGFELWADFAAGWWLLRDSRSPGIRTPPTATTTATTATAWGQTITQASRRGK